MRFVGPDLVGEAAGPKAGAGRAACSPLYRRVFGPAQTRWGDLLRRPPLSQALRDGSKQAMTDQTITIVGARGGSGTSTVAAAVALFAARTVPTELVARRGQRRGAARHRRPGIGRADRRRRRPHADQRRRPSDAIDGHRPGTTRASSTTRPKASLLWCCAGPATSACAASWRRACIRTGSCWSPRRAAA